MKRYQFKVMLTSQLPTQIMDENGERHIIKLTNDNDLLDNIKNSLPHTNSIVVISKNPSGFELNDFIAEGRFKSFALSGIHFKEEIVLDYRNAKNAKSIIENASVIIILGGKYPHQINFLKEIHFKRLIKNFKGLIIGISTGCMKMCKEFINYPEEYTELGQPLLVKGLGLIDMFVVPHCDGVSYLYQSDGIDVVNDYIKPLSFKHEIHAIPDSSYYFYDGNELKLYGKEYVFIDGNVYENN